MVEEGDEEVEEEPAETTEAGEEEEEEAPAAPAALCDSRDAPPPAGAALLPSILAAPQSDNARHLAMTSGSSGVLPCKRNAATTSRLSYSSGRNWFSASSVLKCARSSLLSAVRMRPSASVALIAPERRKWRHCTTSRYLCSREGEKRGVCERWSGVRWWRDERRVHACCVCVRACSVCACGGMCAYVPRLLMLAHIPHTQ